MCQDFYDKLCTTLKDCLTQTQHGGDCALDNDTAYVFKDCDGTFGTDLENYLSDGLASVLVAGTVGELVARAVGVGAGGGARPPGGGNPRG